MFIDILRSAENSAKVIKEIITYKTDGNSVKTVKKELLSLAEVYHDNLINGLFADASEPENGIIIYKDFSPCLEVAKVWNDPTAEQMQKALQNYNGKIQTFSDYEDDIKRAISKGGYIKNDVLYLLKVHGCTETLQKALEVKEEIKQKRIQEEAEKYAKFEAEQRKKEEEARAEAARKKAEKVAFLCGYADGKTQIQTERIYNILSKIQGYREGEKVNYKSRRDFIIDTLAEGGKAEQKDGIVSYYGSKWDRKQSKPKTEYRLYTAEGSYYTITKIEYDFACFMMEKSA